MGTFKPEIVSITSESVIFLIGIVMVTLIPLNNVLINGFLLLLLLIVWLRIKHLKLSKIDLGLKPDFRKTLWPWLSTTTILTIAILVGKTIYPEGLFNLFVRKDQFFYGVMVFYTLVGTFTQEFIFRAYIFARLKKYTALSSTVTSIVLFSLIHLPHLIQLSSSLIYFSILAGVVWSLVYSKFPNLYYAWISHAVVGLGAVLLLGKF